MQGGENILPAAEACSARRLPSLILARFRVAPLGFTSPPRLKVRSPFGIVRGIRMTRGARNEKDTFGVADDQSLPKIVGREGSFFPPSLEGEFPQSVVIGRRKSEVFGRPSLWKADPRFPDQAKSLLPFRIGSMIRPRHRPENRPHPPNREVVGLLPEALMSIY